MESKINFINLHAFEDIISQINRGVPFIEINPQNIEIPFSEISPTEGYEPPVNEETGEHFPNCCDDHKLVLKQSKDWFELFPNCCDPHRKLFSATWFKKENYKDTPLKIVTQLSYTCHHIEKQIETPDWYKNITDYIYANIDSFGQLPTGHGNPVGLHIYHEKLKYLLKTCGSGRFPKEKCQRLFEYLMEYENAGKINNVTDLNVLYATYKKWLNIFPFELSYFSHLKQSFELQLPFLSTQPELNKYTGLSKAKLHTKSSLFEALINITDNLLTQINGLELHKKGLITDANKIKLELVMNSRKLKLQQGYKNSSPDEEHRYRKMLKEWYNDEKKFIDEITPLLKTIPPPPLQEETKDEISEFIEKIASNARGKASDNIETLQNDAKFKISTQEQKLASYKTHHVLFQKAFEKANYPVSNQSILYDKIKTAIENKRVYLDKTYRVWADCKTKSEVYNAIKSELYTDFADYYTTIELAEIIDAIANGEEETSRVSNEEFLKGKYTIGFINGEFPAFKIKKRLETRNLPVEIYLDAILKNWEEAINKENEQDKKLEVLHNALQFYSKFKYDYPHLEIQINRVVTRLDEIGTYLKFGQSKTQTASNNKGNAVPKKILSYKWQIETELPALHNKMEGIFIDMNTTLEQFTAIFTEQPIESITPVKWIESNKLLSYFLYENFKGHYQNWASIGSKLFLNKVGKPFKANDLSQAKNDYKDFGIDKKGKEKIDTILKAIKKPT